jgi:hypothetical protein
MKRLFLISALVGARALAHGQTITAMTEQLIELKLLEQTTATGYQTMTSGVDSIGKITAYDPEIKMPLKGFHARIIRKEPELRNEKLPVIIHPINTSALNAHFAQIRLAMVQLVDSECKKIMVDADKTGLVIK